MNLTEREKVLILVFPAILILAAYVAIFGASSQRALANKREQLTEAQREGVTEQQVWQQRAQLRKLSQDVKKAQTAKDALRIRADELCGGHTASRRDMNSIEALTSLFDRCGLKLTDEAPASSNLSGGMAASLDEATRRLQDSMEEKPENAKKTRRTTTYAEPYYHHRDLRTASDGDFRELQFYGRFLDVVRALEELSRNEDQPIPLSITMKEIGLSGMYSEFRVWTMLVRI